MREGVTLGMVIAALMSWTHNHEVLLAIIHAFCSWFYVIYALLCH